MIGQKLNLEVGPGLIEERVLVGLTQDTLTVKNKDNVDEVFSRDKIRGAQFNIGTLEDALYHIINSGSARHCPYCYLGLLYAVDLLATNYEAQAFSARSDLIRGGIISYLEGSFSMASYSLLPQLDGIIHQILYEDGLLKMTKGYPVWTKEHPKAELHKKPCKNIVQAINGAIEAGKDSRLNFVAINRVVNLEDIRNTRNKMLHGSLLDVTEHQVSSIVYMLHAAYEGVATNLH